MIKDKLINGHCYDSLHPHMRMVMEVLQSLNLSELKAGRIELDGNDVYINVDRVDGRSRSEARLEAHRRYIDIQVPISGPEVMGVMPVDVLKQPAEPYDDSRDIIFYDDEITRWETVGMDEFIIFFPEDGHAPLVECGCDHLKLVVKVRQ